MKRDTGRKDMSLEAQSHRRDRQDCEKVSCNRRQAVCVLLPGEEEAMQL